MSAEPDQIVIKERDYDFLDRNRRRKFKETTRNPLLEERKVNTRKGLNILAQMTTRLAVDTKSTIKMTPSGNFIDPLSRLRMKPNSTIATPNLLANPPAKTQIFTDFHKNVVFHLFSSYLNQIVSEIQEKNPDHEQNENEEESQLWEDIRKDFVKIFDLNVRNLNGPVNNVNILLQILIEPFGTNTVQPEDKTKQIATSAVSGANKYEFDKAAVLVKPTNSYKKLYIKKNTIPMRNYIENLVEMHAKMRKKWLDQDKVGTLQITIQAIKLFSDNDQPKFSPYKYVYIMDILDSFSKFVFLRMKKLSFPQYSAEKLKTLTFFDIAGSNIPESASEISRNWLRKVSSIRELIPRIYIEAALLPIYYFIDPQKVRNTLYNCKYVEKVYDNLIKSKIRTNLLKLSFQSRSIGDYINCVNYCTFILRIGAELLPKEKSHILQMVDDFFYYMKQGCKLNTITNNKKQLIQMNEAQFGQAGMTGEEYLKLFEPFLKTAFRFYSENCSEDEFRDLFNLFQNSNRHSEILGIIIDSFSLELISKYSSEIFIIISSYHVDYKYKMYVSFLPKLARGVQPNSASPIEICQLVWLDLKQINRIDNFLTILVSFIELINKCFQGFHKTRFFQSIIEKFNELFLQVDGGSSSGKDAEMFEKLEKFIRSILTTCDDIREILMIEPFLQFISFFPPQLKSDVSKDVLRLFVEREKVQTITDPVAVYAILQVAKNLNESSTRKDNQKENYLLLKSFFDKIDFGKDLEQMLNLYTEIRANFGHIPEVINYVIDKSISLTFKARNLITSAKMQKKITGFLQACIAFGYITTPMLENPLHQFKHFFINSQANNIEIYIIQVALLHNLVSQSESSFKTALSLLADLPETINGKNIDEQIHTELSNMISFMIVLPDNPESDNLHIYSGFISLLDSLKWYTLY